MLLTIKKLKNFPGFFLNSCPILCISILVYFVIFMEEFNSFTVLSETPLLNVDYEN